MSNFIYNSFMIMPGLTATFHSPLLPDPPVTRGMIPFFRITIEFKKSVRRKYFGHLSVKFRIAGSDPIEINIVKSTGLLIRETVNKAVSGYSFIIDERIYYRKLISRPSLGLSPPELV
jgi:hypothetical protein